MNLARGTWLILAIITSFPFLAQGAAGTRARPTRPAVSDNTRAYKGAIMMDAASGAVLFEDRADTIGPPASMAKLMTFAVVHDLVLGGKLSLQTPVTVSATDSSMGGTQVWLKQGEVFSVEELLYAMMVQSANDAAHALARAAAGSVPAFVAMMNERARELEMTRTTFRTPHGLPPSNRRIDEGDMTTPRDFALLSRHLLRQSEILKYTSVKVRPFGPPVRPTAVEMRNHNNLIGKLAGVDGLKTGFTNAAGFCLSATAQRNGRRVIVVIMGAPDSNTRDLKVSEFLERGFATLPAAPPPAATPADSPIRAAPVITASPARTDASDQPLIKLPRPKK